MIVPLGAEAFPLVGQESDLDRRGFRGEKDIATEPKRLKFLVEFAI
jgi:hypothetical protein